MKFFTRKYFAAQKHVACMLFLLAMLLTGGCSFADGKSSVTITPISAGGTTVEAEVSVSGNAVAKASDSVSDNAISLRTFPFSVVDAEGNRTDFTIETDKETVGEALVAEGLIEGEEGIYGLYVKTVNGITADYDTDGTYWAFYINDEYASSGVDQTPITDGESYTFKVE